MDLQTNYNYQTPWHDVPFGSTEAHSRAFLAQEMALQSEQTAWIPYLDGELFSPWEGYGFLFGKEFDQLSSLRYERASEFDFILMVHRLNYAQSPITGLFSGICFMCLQYGFPITWFPSEAKVMEDYIVTCSYEEFFTVWMLGNPLSDCIDNLVNETFGWWCENSHEYFRKSKA